MVVIGTVGAGESLLINTIQDLFAQMLEGTIPTRIVATNIGSSEEQSMERKGCVQNCQRVNAYRPS